MKKATLSKKLTSYAAIAGGIMAANHAGAQIVYTDVDPDVTLQPGDFFDLDLNNDGTVDLIIDAGQNQANTWKKVEVYASGSNLNSVAGYLGPFSFYYASIFSAGSNIDNTRTWYGASPYLTLAIVYTSGAAYGPWAGATDGYLGVRVNIGADQIYGWVRMDVSNDGGTGVVKDYAYEATLNKGIIAGAMNVGIEPVIVSEDLKIHAANKILYVQSNNLTLPAALTVQNAVGQVVKLLQLESAIQNFDLSDLSTGVYVISNIDGKRSNSGKVVL